MSFPSANILQLKKRGNIFYSDEIPDADYVPGMGDVIRSAAIEVSNDDVLVYFTNRADYITGAKPHIGGSTEYLTGTYQQPDLGTYTGDVNDLTETQITNLSIGLDYDGLGSSVLWSTLEKVWILENLDTTSSSGVKRYGFSFTYDSGVSSLHIANSGALGVPEAPTIIKGVLNGGGNNETDWINPVAGLAQNWTEINTGLTTSIITGNGFTGNAQRAEVTTPASSWYILSDLFAAEIGVRYRLSFKYRGNAPDTGSDDAKLSVEMYDSVNGSILRLSLATNTGNALYYEADFIATTATIRVKFNPSWSNPVLNEYIEIDEVNVSRVGTTDWIDSNLDGLGDNWTKTVILTPAIVTGNGFTGNAQKISSSAAEPALNIYSDLLAVSDTSTYILSCRYRGYDVNSMGRIVIKDSIDTTLFSTLIPINTGNAIVFQTSGFTPGVTSILIEVHTADNIDDGTIGFQIDEIELIEI